MKLQTSLAASLLALLAAGCGPPTTPETVVVSEAEAQALFDERFERLKANGGFLKKYSPMEPIIGASKSVPLTEAGPEELTISSEALDKAEAYAEANNSSAFMVWHKGKLLKRSFFGEANPDTLMVSKSLSKPIAAIAVGRAIELEKIKSLDQSASDYITEWKGTPKEAILVRHILDMRTGLIPQNYDMDPNSVWNQAYISPYHDRYIVETYPLVDTPGEVYGYSNAVGDLAGVLIERATGQKYEDFLSQELLNPLGAKGGEIWINRPGGTVHSACCMNLPADTYLRFGILLAQNGVFNGKQIISSDYISEMKKGTEQNEHYGLGIWGGPYAERRGFTGKTGPGPKVLHSAPYADPDLFLFDGNSNQTVFMSQKNDLVVLRLGQRPPKSPEWDNSILPNIVINGIK